MFEQYFPHVKLALLWQNTYETIYMTFVSGVLAAVLGLLIGIVLFLTAHGQLLQSPSIYRILSAVVNVFRAIPFLILIVLLIPLTKWLVGSILGVNAALPALVIGASPFYARLVEIALREVDKGVIEASRAMGANIATIIWKVLIPESSPALVSGLTVTLIALVGATATAGVIGAGGLGNLAYLEGFQRSHNDVTIVATVVIVIIVYAIQIVGDQVTAWLDRR